MKICPLEDELLHTDGHADRHDEISAFRQFCDSHLKKN